MSEVTPKLSRLTRSDFEVIADSLCELVGMISNKARRELIDANIEHLKRTNPAFDAEKFRDACRY